MNRAAPEALPPELAGPHAALAALRASPARTDVAARRAHLASLATEVRRAAEEFAPAIDADFGGRPSRDDAGRGRDGPGEHPLDLAPSPPLDAA
jgi:hypothetical protein